MENFSTEQDGYGRRAFETEIANELSSALNTAAQGCITVKHIQSASAKLGGVDFSLELDADGRSACVAVEALRNGYPRDVQGAIWRLHEFKQASAHRPNRDLILLVAAESLSPGARELLRKSEIGYFERNGNLNLRWRNWLFDIERLGLPVAKKESTAIFTDSREAVVHALLINRAKWMKGGELAELSQTSQYTVSVVLQELERRELCDSRGAGRMLRRRLIEPRKLLDAWATHWTKRKETRTRWHFFTDRSDLLPAKLTDKIGSLNPTFSWAVTGTAAANAYAPLLTTVDTVEIIVPPGKAENLARNMRLKHAEKGANVVFVERERAASFLFRTGFPGCASYFASPFIIYLDLLDGRGRNKELAAHVLKALAI
ncbi:type IV toxin-antitoxin system AbiEi family antitoxin [Paraburkholderia bannensis]|uniref:type IV toxin-antitoxin system AbiEi family antitoxin n=1 Tax=Paraburkholderia bannensis TaxID=765414 RepID=UPI002AC336D0|nr:type IV toxin-antitoxin system AbiEi family antitoxin [Paraburkholderia bannensis]